MVIPFYCEDYPENPDDFEIVDDARSPFPPKKSPNDAATQLEPTPRLAVEKFKTINADFKLTVDNASKSTQKRRVAVEVNVNVDAASPDN